MCTQIYIFLSSKQIFGLLWIDCSQVIRGIYCTSIFPCTYICFSVDTPLPTTVVFYIIYIPAIYCKWILILPLS